MNCKRRHTCVIEIMTNVSWEYVGCWLTEWSNVDDAVGDGDGGFKNGIEVGFEDGK